MITLRSKALDALSDFIYPDDIRGAVECISEILMSEIKEMRVHTDGYNWKRGNGPFVVWEEIEDMLNKLSGKTEA